MLKRIFVGTNPLWLADWLSQRLELTPGMRVLDLGCGKALSSIFLAKEFGVTVWAADYLIKPNENMERIERAGFSNSVFPVSVEAHALPFSERSFDAIVSFDAYHYFGTDDLYLGYISSFLKPGGRLGIVVPGAQEGAFRSTAITFSAILGLGLLQLSFSRLVASSLGKNATAGN